MAKLCSQGTRLSSVRSVVLLRIVRCHPDGSLDTSFDGDGFFLRAAGPFAVANAVVRAAGRQDRRGRVRLVTARATSCVLRLLANGTPDPDFAGGGLIRTFVGGESEAYDVVLQPDGKILVAGVAGNDSLLVRYLPNGELDPAFEGDGVTLVQFSAGRDQADALALQA